MSASSGKKSAQVITANNAVARKAAKASGAQLIIEVKTHGTDAHTGRRFVGYMIPVSSWGYTEFCEHMSKLAA